MAVKPQQIIACCRQSVVNVDGARSSNADMGSFIWIIMFCSSYVPLTSLTLSFATSQADNRKAIAKREIILLTIYFFAWQALS